MKVLKHSVGVLGLFILIALAACKKDDEPEEEPARPVYNYITNEYCENSCYFANDGECDDGGYGSKTDFCNYGTDCEDCGIRILKEIRR